ncbi:BBT_HP_G0103720.mRNA.1.CDS.1 [Saccharomyces cerevisiae]|nr:hypothetical protein H826_YJM1463P00084 [Saccharomyces cerevisiae YJM1463]CAI4985531.1 BBT_HP_G0067720.mRNA.1.CDS.1 [Saccharomyces cerevisiae]CAI5026670.1 BBT_HP_G0103720.mRNA.1.CDS.1 [Saccharomyces cerevisiae]CAI6835031.1 BBT_HP_G0067720.mRNA.1.CDS.1 [Saccharomyces cerevisiae]CAI6943050.1 BBT_HP_G0103720.mRNA.1.CDS.1 [Saccharomyces cerevisiae]
MDLSFTTKSVKINGQNHRILLQNENGPCALLALANILILSPDHTRFSNELIRLVNKGSQISLKELIEVLADIALQVTDKPSTDINELLSLLPRLHEGLNINPEFNGSFENTKEMSIFRLFNVDVVHGWVINSFINENIDEKLSHYSYESAQRILTQAADINCGISQDENSDEVLRDAMHLGLFLNESPTQLTAFGLLRLREKLLHNKFSILFRNDHFSTLFKYEDRLYTLVTDFGYKNCKDIVWQSLDSVDGSCDAFFAGNFSAAEVNGQQLSTDIERDFGTGNLLLEEIQQIENDKELAKQLQEQEQERVTKFEAKRKIHSHKKNSEIHAPVKKDKFKRRSSLLNAKASEKEKSECVVM